MEVAIKTKEGIKWHITGFAFTQDGAPGILCTICLHDFGTFEELVVLDHPGTRVTIYGNDREIKKRITSRRKVSCQNF